MKQLSPRVKSADRDAIANPLHSRGEASRCQEGGEARIPADGRRQMHGQSAGHAAAKRLQQGRKAPSYLFVGTARFLQKRNI
jgi:hypothetical protein